MWNTLCGGGIPIAVLCMCVCVWHWDNEGDVCYLSQNVGAVPMESIDFSIKAVYVGSSFHRAGTWTVLLQTLPFASLTHTVSAHNWISIASAD